jgi:hypothetical protein
MIRLVQGALVASQIFVSYAMFLSCLKDSSRIQSCGGVLMFRLVQRAVVSS